MDAQQDDFLEGASARYEAAKTEGQQEIRRRWRWLAPETRTALVGGGFYSARGERLAQGESETGLPLHDAEGLEQAVGTLKRCLAAQLPLVTEKGWPIPQEAHNDEILEAASDLLLVREWQDPVFLRLALAAVAKHQQAHALIMHPAKPVSGSVLGCAGSLLKAVLYLAMPAALAAGLVAAARQDVGAAVLAFYLLGFGVMAVLSVAGIGVKKDGFELAYARWDRFQIDGAVGITGAGAFEYLKRMAGDGVRVPSIAFDVAETLRSRTTVGQPVAAAQD